MQGIDEHQKEIVKIAQNEKEPTFENTLEALESSGKTLDKVANVFYNLLGSNTNDEFDALAVKMSPLLSAHNDKILLNKELFERIKKRMESRSLWVDWFFGDDNERTPKEKLPEVMPDLKNFLEK